MTSLCLDAVTSDSCFSHLLPAREGPQGDVSLHVALLVQGEHLGASALLPARRGQVVDQLEGGGLVHGVGVGPVDADLEGFLDGSRWGNNQRVRMRGNQTENYRVSEIISHVRQKSNFLNGLYLIAFWKRRRAAVDCVFIRNDSAALLTLSMLPASHHEQARGGVTSVSAGSARQKSPADA